METQRRFQFLETVALWEGEITASRIVDYFGVSRPTAQKVISAYRQKHPTNFNLYDNHQKAHVPGTQFKSHYSKGNFSEYLSFFGAEEIVASATHTSSQPYINNSGNNNSGNNHSANSHSANSHLALLPSPQRNVEPNLIRCIVKACKQKMRLDIGYYSVSSGSNEGRIISPHSIVFDGVRWHVRAWCERNQAYRDFVLSRFHDVPVFEEQALHTKEQDHEWNHIVDLIIQPDQRLTPAQSRAVELDYKMLNGQLVIPCRAALIKYLLQHLRLDSYQQNPQGQQIIVEAKCWQDIAPYRMH